MHFAIGMEEADGIWFRPGAAAAHLDPAWVARTPHAGRPRHAALCAAATVPLKGCNLLLR